MKAKSVDKIWVESYPEGVPADVTAPPWRSIRDLFEHSFAAYPDNAAYSNMGKTLSYADLNQLSMQFACFLQKKLGLTRGEVSFILLGELTVLTLAAIPIGFLIGRWLGALMVAGFQSELYRIPLVIAPETYAMATIVVLASALVSGFIIQHKVKHLDMVEALKMKE